jgi:hypothetical protein
VKVVAAGADRGPRGSRILSSVEDLDPSGLLAGFSLATILLAVFFGLVGFAAFRYGRKNSEPRPLILGLALMAYGYFVTNAWVSLAIGSVLTLALFFPR